MEVTVPNTFRDSSRIVALFGILLYRYLGSETVSFDVVGSTSDVDRPRITANVEIDFTDDPVVKEVFRRVGDLRLEFPWRDFSFIICRAPENIAQALAGSYDCDGTFEVHWSRNDSICFSFAGGSAATITRLRDHFVALATEAKESSDLRTSQVTMLSATESEPLLRGATDGFKNFPGTTIPKAFRSKVESTPNAIALRSNGISVTYQEIYARALQIALSLQLRFVHVESIVGVCLDDPVITATIYLGILMAGGVVMALDHEWPREVAQERILQAKPIFVVTDATSASTIASDSVTVIFAESLAVDTHNARFVPPDLSPNNAAYIIYTSGSTGVPKGIIGLHRTVTSAQHAAPLVDGKEVFAQSADLAFGAGLIGFFFALLRGACLVLVSRTVMRDPSALLKLWRSEEVTRLVLVPPQLRQLAVLDREEIAKLTSIRTVALAGATLTRDVLENAYAMFPHARITNGYTCLEVGVMSTRWETTPETRARELSVGRPLSNVRIYILGPQMNLLPWGMPGEICIGSPDLSRGYINQPDLTRARFLPNPFLDSNSERVYRTGDIGRLLPSGELQYLGRKDHQVKIRGIRIEVEEIESLLQGMPQVYQAAVVKSDGPVDARLIAYLSSKPKEHLSISALREHLSSHLPAYMVPALFVVCEDLPMTPNGKLNRQALPAQETRPELDTVYVPPQNEFELAVKDIWESALGIRGIGVKDHFLELGGDSLLAVQIAIRLQGQFGCGLSVASLFRFPTIQELAGEISALLRR